MMGAIIVDEVVPYVTTHVIALEHTPHLKYLLNSMESNIQENITRNGFNLNQQKKQLGKI